MEMKVGFIWGKLWEIWTHKMFSSIANLNTKQITSNY